MTSPPKWVVIADDLTGAADAAARFAERGETRVVVRHQSPWSDADTLAVDTETRALAAGDAAAVVRTVAERAVRIPATSVVKKIDSLLRGSVGAEVRALLDVFAAAGRPVLAVVAPAFPALGRTTRAGVVHVDGYALPAPTGDVAALLSGAGVRTAAPRAAGGCAATLAAELLRLRAAGFEAVVVDAATDAELAVVARAVAGTAGHTIPVGSGGLCGHIATAATAETAPASTRSSLPGGNVLFVVGSYAERARRQVATLAAAGAEVIEVDAFGYATATQWVRAALARSDVVVTPVPGDPVDRSHAAAVAGMLAAVAAPAARDAAAVLAAGGDTAFALLEALGTERLRVVGELAPGIVEHRAYGIPGVFVTKAGSFGGEDALVGVLHLLRGRDEGGER